MINPKLLELADSKGGYSRNRGISKTIVEKLHKVYLYKNRLDCHWQVEEIDGDHEAAPVDAVEAVVVMEKNAAIREVEVEAIAENATVAVVVEATVVATRGVVAPSAIVTVNCYAI